MLADVMPFKARLFQDYDSVGDLCGFTLDFEKSKMGGSSRLETEVIYRGSVEVERTK